MHGRFRLLCSALVLSVMLSLISSVNAHPRDLDSVEALPDGMHALGHDHPAASEGGRSSDLHARMNLLSTSPSGATNSDIAFWGDHAYVGNYNGFRIFNIADTKPVLVTSFACFGPQNDPTVWDVDGDNLADLLFLSVDRTLSGPECGAVAVAHDDPTGWEGIRIFDVSDPANPRLLKAVYQDCGSHTHTLYPDRQRNRLLLLNSSYPLRPGPTCGPVRGPEAGRDPLHGVIQVVEVPLGDPMAAEEIAELPISYPGDPDGKFDPAEHELGGLLSLRACHDIAVFLEPMLVAGACAEQAQLWRIDPATMLPDTANPLWIFDDSQDVDGPGGGDVAVDFWHSATFSWDGKVVNFIDESFGDGCPPVTNIRQTGAAATEPSDTGRMFFLSAATGELLSTFMLPRSEAGAYCSAHLGNTVPAPGRNLLVNAWYMGGVNVIDFTDPRSPAELAFFDAGPAGASGSDNWSAYWYERSPAPQGTSLAIYGNDGVHSPSTGRGFEAFKAFVGPTKRMGLPYLNPQTQEQLIR